MDTDEEETRSLLRRDYTVFEKWIEDDHILDLIDKDDYVLIDSYYVDMLLLRKVNESCRRLIVIDDNMRLPYEEMTIINPNYFGVYLDYPQDRGNRYYLGKDCTLLRREFKRNGPKVIREKVENILITFGGTDVLQMTDKVIAFIKGIDSSVHLDVVATPVFPNMEAIRDAMGAGDELHIGITAQEMAALMEKADFAAASGGQSSNELIRMQCPAALMAVADNQVLNLKYLSQHGTIRTFDAADMSAIRDLFAYQERKRLADGLADLYSDKNAADVIIDLMERTDGQDA
ncbi:MAG: hypothetical protein ACOX4I_05875 [Anaerovoracaceae bacterium]